MIITLNGEEFQLTPEKALIHLATHSALLADLHLGKSAHFRKSGIAVPGQIIFNELLRLARLIKKYDLQNMYFLGDLFHSHLNNEWQIFEDFLREHQHMNFMLIKGNHDILPNAAYNRELLTVENEPYQFGAFTLTHHPLSSEALLKNPAQYNIAGHIHPGVVVHGKGRNNLKLACYHKMNQQLILPAFGKFTGLVSQKRAKKSDEFFAVTEEKVFQIKLSK